METPPNYSPILSSDRTASSVLRESPPELERLAPVLTDNERAASRRRLKHMHPGNRLRLMAGLPLLPESQQS
jgi:hypothetical protein